MNKLLPSIAGVACFLWVSGWTWFFSGEEQQQGEGNTDQAPITILFEEQQYKVQQPFAFQFAEATPIVGEALIPAIKAISKRLVEHQQESLKILGMYGATERNNTSFANLGLARAEAIRSMLETAGAPVERVTTQGLESGILMQMGGSVIGAVYFSFSENTGDTSSEIAQMPVETTKSDEIGSPSFVFSYGYGNYKLEKSHKPDLEQLRDKLRSNPKLNVILTGYSSKGEEAASARINLAEMRASYLRRFLVDNGVRRSQITTVAKPSMSPSEKEQVATAQLLAN